MKEKKKAARMDPVVHFVMPYENHERLMKFYQKAFGWHMQKFGQEMGNYVVAQTTETDDEMMVKTPGTINGGFFPREVGPDLSPSVIIAVEDIAEAMKKVVASGGKVLGEPMEIPGIGRYVAFTDTEGNRAGMLQPAMGT